MGNKQQLAGKDQVLNPQNFLRHLNINTDQSFDSKTDNQNTTRVNTTGVNDTTISNTQSPLKLDSPKSKRKKKQVMLSKNPNQRDTQIFQAKKNYEKKKLQNQTKLAQIRQKIQTYNRIYRDNDEQPIKNQYQQNKQQQEVIIWGKKVTLRKGNPMQQYYQYRYPKQPISDQDDKYTNWQIYKNQMSKAKFKQLQKEQKQLLDEQEQLRQQYESLIRQKNQVKNQSRFLFKNDLNNDQNGITDQDKQIIATPSFKNSQKLTYVEQTPLNKKQKNQPQTASTDQKISLLFTEEPPKKIDDWKHPQNIINSDPEYIAKQMHYYETYMKNKRSNYVSLKQLQFLQQYPAKRQTQAKPDRTKQTIVDPYLQSLQKKRRKKSRKTKENSRSKSKPINESMYTKVYEKIPKKRNSLHKSPEQRFQAARNLYPWQDSSRKSKKSRADDYPSYVKVNDSLHHRKEDEGTLYFHFISREDEGNKDWMNRKNSNFSIPEGENFQSDEKIQSRRRITYQRQMQSRILEKVRIKNL